MLRLYKKIIDFLFPEYCINCKVPVIDYGLCPTCFKNLEVVNLKTSCKICCFDLGDIEGDFICGNCIISPPVFDRNFSLFKYNKVAKKLVIGFKLLDMDFLCNFFLKFATKQLEEYFDDIDIVTCTPMHFRRLLLRNYNPPEIIAFHLAKKLNKPYYPKLILKHKYTNPQASLTRKQRITNLKGSISLGKDFSPIMKGKNVLLVDDVISTGSTLNECAKILKESGFNKVYCLTLAKN